MAASARARGTTKRKDSGIAARGTGSKKGATCPPFTVPMLLKVVFCEKSFGYGRAVVHRRQFRRLIGHYLDVLQAPLDLARAHLRLLDRIGDRLQLPARPRQEVGEAPELGLHTA